MAILGPNGEILEGTDKPVIPVAPGGTLQLKVGPDGQVIDTGSALLVFDPGEWIILPMTVWQTTLRKLMIAAGPRPDPTQSRAERRRRARDRRN